MLSEVGAPLSREEDNTYQRLGGFHDCRYFRGDNLEQTGRDLSCHYHEERRVQHVKRLLDNFAVLLHNHEIAFDVQVYLPVPREGLPQRWEVQLDLSLHPILELLYHRDEL